MDHQTFFPEGTHDNLSKLTNVFQRQAHRRNTVMHKNVQDTDNIITHFILVFSRS